MLSLSGRAGTIQLDLANLDPSGLVAFKMLKLPAPPGGKKERILLALATPDKDRFNASIPVNDAQFLCR